MAKKITPTPEITAAIQKIAGDVDVSKLSIFEGVVANTLPLSKRGSLFDKATMTESTLGDIAEFLNKGGAPFLTMHMPGLPVGKVFRAGVVTSDNGLRQTNAQWFIDPSEPQLAEKMNNGTIDETSLGILHSHLLCSECGFDYRGPDATIMNLLDQTCANGHTIGENGVHLNLSGVEKVYELSAVDRGAVNNPKILSRSQLSADGKKEPLALAANVMPVDALVLIASATKETPKMAGETHGVTVTLDANKLVADLSAATTTVTTLTTERDGLKAQLEAKTKEFDALKLASTETPEAKAKREADAAALTASTEFLRDQTKKVLVALGEKEPKVDTLTVAEMTAKITEGQAKLGTLITPGGVTNDASSGTDTNKKRDLSAFTTRKA